MAATLTITGGEGKTWALLPSAIEQAMQTLGITRPVTLSVVAECPGELNDGPGGRWNIRGNSSIETPNEEKLDAKLRALNVDNTKGPTQAQNAQAAKIIDTWPGMHHIVFVRRELTAKQATETIWHELTHCAQRDKEGPLEMGMEYALADGILGYGDNPFEAEARESAAKHAPGHPLVAADSKAK